MPTSKHILFDTNVLIYNQDQDSPFYDAAQNWHQQAAADQITAYISSQNLTEFAAVMADPKRVPHPLTHTQIATEIDHYLSHPTFKVIYPNEVTLSHFCELLRLQSPKNPKHTFDLFLVATMTSHQVFTLVTHNPNDFTAIGDLEVIPLQ